MKEIIKGIELLNEELSQYKDDPDVLKEVFQHIEENNESELEEFYELHSYVVGKKEFDPIKTSIMDIKLKAFEDLELDIEEYEKEINQMFNLCKVFDDEYNTEVLSRGFKKIFKSTREIVKEYNVEMYKVLLKFDLNY